MATLYGKWRIQVKSRHAAFPQRFIVLGAAVGDGTYPGDPSASEIAVEGFTGQTWILKIQNNPGSGFVDSQEHVGTPIHSGGISTLEIASNDQGNDQDFNDLVLVCRQQIPNPDIEPAVPSIVIGGKAGGPSLVIPLFGGPPHVDPGTPWFRDLWLCLAAIEIANATDGPELHRRLLGATLEAAGKELHRIGQNVGNG
jgi:hypothetical protein